MMLASELACHCILVLEVATSILSSVIALGGGVYIEYLCSPSDLWVLCTDSALPGLAFLSAKAQGLLLEARPYRGWYSSSKKDSQEVRDHRATLFIYLP